MATRPAAHLPYAQPLSWLQALPFLSGLFLHICCSPKKKKGFALLCCCAGNFARVVGEPEQMSLPRKNGWSDGRHSAGECSGCISGIIWLLFRWAVSGKNQSDWVWWRHHSPWELLLLGKVAGEQASVPGSERPGLGVPALSGITAVKLKWFQPAQSYQGKVSVVDDKST